MKRYIAISIAAAMATTILMAQEAETKASVDTVKLQKKVEKLEKSLKKLKKQLSKVKAHDAQDNIKWSVDFRTAVDHIKYTTAQGNEYKNSSLLSNRLWLNMAYAPSANMIFKGQLSFNKAYGATPANPVNGYPQRGYGYDTFDWVLNENLLDDKVRVREAYWLYMSDSFFDTDISWTASFGRRPSTNGFLISLRDDDKPRSPLGHTINVEFDGASFKFGLDKVTGISGMYWKFCLGRGLTNARSRFNMDGGLASMGDYAKDKTTLKDVDLAGFIFVPYDDGQYKIMTTYYRGFNLPGFNMATPAMLDPNAQNTGMLALVDSNGNGINDTMVFNDKLTMSNVGDQDGAAISILIDGIGDGINDFLDETKFFASFAWSKTNPDNEEVSLNLAAIQQGMGQIMQQNPNMTQQEAMEALFTDMGQGVAQIMQQNPSLTEEQAMGMLMQQQGMIGSNGMLGSNDSETGTSYWVGIQTPVLFTEDGRFGLEYNHGSKYWRPFTYAEDTLVGSKMAVRGDAIEAYYIQPLMKGFSAELRYTKLNYDYTGSQGFFGAGGTPMSMEEAKANGMDPIEEAEDIRLSLRYRF